MHRTRCAADEDPAITALIRAKLAPKPPRRKYDHLRAEHRAVSFGAAEHQQCNDSTRSGPASPNTTISVYLDDENAPPRSNATVWDQHTTDHRQTIVPRELETVRSSTQDNEARGLRDEAAAMTSSVASARPASVPASTSLPPSSELPHPTGRASSAALELVCAEQLGLERELQRRRAQLSRDETDLEQARKLVRGKARKVQLTRGRWKRRST